MKVIMKFSNRTRYRKAINHLWNNSGKYNVKCRGKDYGTNGWYIEFDII